MKNLNENVCYDKELNIEAYCFEGNLPNFPNHFHDYYVIGFAERGRRILKCMGKEYTFEMGSIMLLNPGDSHCCENSDSEPLYYRSINISKERMAEISRAVTGKYFNVNFSNKVIKDNVISSHMEKLHKMIMRREKNTLKEEMFAFFISRLIEKYGYEEASQHREELNGICRYIEKNYMNKITLENLCFISGLSKSTLLRVFDKEMGTTPYRYIESVRINNAKKLMEAGEIPVMAALKTGFSEQSHLNRYFKSFIGISPGCYKEIFNNRNGERYGKQ